MRRKIRLLTKSCCDSLLEFQSDIDKRKRYDEAVFPEESLEFLSYSSKFELDTDLVLNPQPSEDVNSSIEIFSQLSNLDRVQANDRRLWVALTHGQFYSYTKQRWNYTAGYSNDAIIRRFHFEGSSLEARMRNSISRLWWGARITYDVDREDPFELTRVLWSKQDLIQNVVERSYGTYENVVKGILETYIENPSLTEGELRSLYTGLNAIGGVKVLSYLEVSEVKDAIRSVANYNTITLA